MTFTFTHSHHDEPPIKVPAIGLDLFVRLPPEASGGVPTIIETINAPGFGAPVHKHAETEVFRVIEGGYLYERDGNRFCAATGGAPGKGALNLFDHRCGVELFEPPLKPGLNA